MASLTLSGCVLDPFAEKPKANIVIIDNDLGQAVRINYPAGGSMQGEVPPTSDQIFTFDLDPSDATRRCMTSDILFTTTDGVQLGRIPPPICLNRTLVLSSYLDKRGD